MIKSFKQVLLREFKRFFKSKDLILICIIAPFIYSFGITYIYHKQNPRDIKIAVVNQDNSSVSRTYGRMIDSTPELNIVDYFPSTYAAYNAIFTNKIDLFYFIPNNFSTNLKRAKSTFAFIGANASNFMVSSSAIKTIVMTSQFLSAQVLTKFLIKNGISKNSAIQMIQPIKGNFKWMFNPTKTYANFFVPFVLLAIFQQILIVAVCHTMSLETQEKTWSDLYKITNNKVLPILFGKAIPYVLIALFMILLFVFLVFPFNSIFQTSKLNLLLLSIIYSFVIVFFAMGISHLFKSPVVSLCALTFYSMPVLLISGFAWPIYMLPEYVKIAAYIFPSTYFINIFRFYSLNTIWIGYATYCVINLALFFLVCLALNIIIFKFKIAYNKKRQIIIK
ncbi:MAG: ABC transporter permease [Endomicrobiaceae bacterium]|nr:ABC transporter permease [Endomicrobiaceae bacterium]